MEEDLQRKGRPQGTTRQVSSAEGEGGEAYHTGRLAGMAPQQSNAGCECSTSCLPISGAA